MASNRCTWLPQLDNSSAAIKPAGPPPTMDTSKTEEANGTIEIEFMD
jgi:hypothetical protein